MATPHFPSQSQLMDELAVAPEVDVIGIVAPPGGSATLRPGLVGENFCFSLHSWRFVGAGVRTEKVIVRKKPPKEGVEHFGKLLCGYSVVKLRLRLAEQSCYPGIQALMVAPPEPGTDDAELSQMATNLQIPVTVATERFGVFTLNRNIYWYESNGHCSWNGQPADLRLFCDDDEDEFSERCLERAIQLWDDEANWDTRLRTSMIAELLPVKNQGWLQDDQAAISKEDFLNAVNLTAIDMNSDGSFEFYYDDGGLFCGHCIVIGGSLAEGVTDVAFYG